MKRILSVILAMTLLMVFAVNISAANFSRSGSTALTGTSTSNAGTMILTVNGTTNQGKNSAGNLMPYVSEADIIVSLSATYDLIYKNNLGVQTRTSYGYYNGKIEVSDSFVNKVFQPISLNAGQSTSLSTTVYESMSGLTWYYESYFRVTAELCHDVSFNREPYPDSSIWKSVTVTYNP